MLGATREPGNCVEAPAGDRLAAERAEDSMGQREAEPGDIALKGRDIEIGSDYVGSLATRTRLKCLLRPRLFARLGEGWPRFSEGEMARRRAAIETVLEKA